MDFRALGEIGKRKVFAGASRATMNLPLVMAEEAREDMFHRFEMQP